MRPHSRLKENLLLAAMLSLPASAPAAVTLQGTRIVHDASKGRDVTVRASNTGDDKALAQVWIDAGDDRARPEDVRVPFHLTPAAPRLLQPHQGQAYRITYAPRPSDPALPVDRESVFYFNLLDIPPKPADAAEKNLLQFAVRTRIKLFFRPEGLPGKAADAAAALQWKAAHDAVVLHNPTAYHVTLGSVATPDGTSLAADMVPPFGTLHIALPDRTSMPAQVSYSWLDDYGALRQGQTIVADHDDAAQSPKPARVQP